MSVKEVATHLGLSTKTVRRYIHSGQLRAFKLGTAPNATLRIPTRAVIDFVTVRGAS
jgi:excisionase family DNA binding protein